jgi:hypothetical protein
MSTLKQSLADAITSGDIGEAQDPSMTENYSVKANYYDIPRPVEPDRDEVEIDRPLGEAIGYGGDYNINIETLTSGYILRVGCQSIAVESGADVAKLIEIYLSKDKTIGNKWMSSEKIVQNFIKENLQVK